MKTLARRGTALLALAMASILFATACSSGEGTPAPRTVISTVQDFPDTPTPTREQTSSAPSETTTIDPYPGPTHTDRTGTISDAAFVQLVQENVPTLSGYESSDIVILGNLVCNDFDNGGDVPAVLGDVFNIPGITPYEAGFFIGVSVPTYCPEYQPLLDAYPGN